MVDRVDGTQQHHSKHPSSPWHNIRQHDSHQLAGPRADASPGHRTTMASPHPPQPPRHSFFASGPPIPFNAGAHGFHQPTPASHTFGGPARGAHGSLSPALTALPSSPASQQHHPQQNPFLVAWGGTKQSFGSTAQAGPSTGLSSGQVTSQPSYVPGFGTSKKRRPEYEEHSGSRRLDEAEDGLEGARVIVGRKGVKRARGTRTEGGPTAAVDHDEDAGKVNEQDVDVGVLLGGVFLLRVMISNTRSPEHFFIRIASLPPTTHLQILLSLLESQPTLRSSILSLVPSLDVQFCVDDLQAKARAVVAAVPLGAGMGVGMVRSGSGLFGAGRSSFDQGRNTGAMSEGYALNRLRGPTNEFCATVSGVEWFGSGLCLLVST
jgi:hypothetical protein